MLDEQQPPSRRAHSLAGIYSDGECLSVDSIANAEFDLPVSTGPEGNDVENQRTKDRRYSRSGSTEAKSVLPSGDDEWSEMARDSVE